MAALLREVVNKGALNIDVEQRALKPQPFDDCIGSSRSSADLRNRLRV